MAVTGTITTRFIDENGVDLGKQLIEKDYLISLYPNLFPQYKTSGLYLWGGNSSGQIGDNTVVNKSSPVQTVTYGYTWKQVAYGSSHTVGLKNDGTLWSWGSNAYGQVGDGTLVSKSSPIQVTGYATSWQQVSAGYQHSAGVKTDGTLWTWGLNNYGQLGDNSVGNKAIPVPAETGDPYFNYNALVLTGDGVNNGTNSTFLDSSGNNLSITRNGNVTQGTFTPYSMPDGYWSNYFSGVYNSNNEYLSVPASNAFLFDGDHTIEAWIWWDGTYDNTGRVIYSTGGSGSADQMGIFSGAGLVYANTYVDVASNYPPANQWCHVAASRSGTTVRLFINGVQTAVGTKSGNIGSNSVSPTIGKRTDNIHFWNGYICNLRIVKGTALYTSSFTPDRTPLTAISGTSLLTCQSNRFVDKSLNNFTITAFSNCYVSSISPFINYSSYSALLHGGSSYFDGSGDYLSLPAVTSLTLGGVDFTLEAWVYIVSTAEPYQHVFKFTTNNICYIDYNTSTDGILSSQVGATVATKNGVTPNVWHHIAVVRRNGSVTCYVDGIAGSPVALDPGLTSATVAYVGVDVPGAGPRYLRGFISDLRILKSTALYTANFTPPTAPLQRITNTALLLSFTNGQITDSIRKNILETVGDAKTSTSATKYGSSSMYFDGNGDYLTSRLNDTYAFSTGDFTIEMWINPSTTNHQSACLISQEHISAQNSPISISIFLNNGSFETVGNQLGFGQYNGTLGSTWTIQEHGITTIATNTWTHIALVRYGTRFTMFVNGVALRTVTSSVSCSIGNTQYFIARRWDTYGSYPYFNGYIDDLRITKGVARYTGNFTPPRSLLLPVAGTSLLTCQNRRFIDNSLTASSLTVAGDTSVQPWSPFTATSAYDATSMGGSGYFDGTGDYLTLAPGAAFQFGTGDFTVECWAYRTTTAAASYYYIDARNSGQTSLWCLLYENSANRLCFFNGTAYAVTSSTIPPDNSWYHVAYTRSGTTGRLFLNGVQIGTATDSYNYNVAPTTSYIGCRYTLDYLFQGYLAGMRVIKGTAVYTSNFTPPTGPLTAITNTQLLLNFTNAGIFDLTGKNNIETVGDAKISTSVKKYGSGSVAFDGTGDYLTVSQVANPLLDLAAGDFTVECWFYANSLSATTYTALMGFHDNNTSIWGAYVRSNGVFIYGSGGTLTGAGTVNTSTWYHFAATRSGSTVRVFLDGVQQASSTVSGSYTTGSNLFRIGYDNSSGNIALNGYIDDLRITKGFARYTSNFTPPTAAFGVDPYFNLTSLLISGDGVNNAQNNTFIDSSTNNFTITRYGNSTQGSFTPFSLPEGNWSNYFDGSGDYLSVPDSSNWVFDTDWTVEAWIYMTASPTNSYNIIIGQQADGISTGWSMGVDANGLYFYAEPNNGSWSLSAGAISLNTWTHIAASGASNVGRLFINGVLKAYSSYTGTFKDIAYPLVIGTTSNNTNRYYAGYVSNARVIKGRALYTANFTPTQNFTGTGSTTWRNVSCGKYFTAATKTDGSVWTWGYNTNGQLGDYSVIHRSSAVQVLSTGNTWQQVSTGYHTAGIKLDGTMWMWGKNNLGQLGDNTIVHKSYPSQMTSGDPYYNRTVLLLNANGTNNGQNNTFIDSSTNNFTITRNGNATQGSFTPNSVPEGYWSIFLNGSSRLTIPSSTSFDFGTGDFTIECWINLSSASSVMTIVDNYLNSTTGWALQWRSDTVSFNFGWGDTGLLIYPAAGPVGTWTHIAVTRIGSALQMFINGILVKSAVNTTNFTGGNNLAIGDLYFNSWLQPFNGYLSNLRIVKGFAVYTQNFTPLTVPLTAINGTVLLACQSNRFKENSSGLVMTPNGLPSISPFSPFTIPTEYSTTNNGGSGYFDGSGDYLLSPTNTAVAPGSGDFTIECWIYATAASDQAIYEGRLVNLNSSGFTLTAFSSTVIRTYSSAVLISGTVNNILNRWCHVAVCRSSGTTRLFVDGTVAGSAADTTNYTDNRAVIGAGVYGGSLGGGAFTGYISGFRIIKGTALYTSSFTPSTTPPAALSNTGLLLNFTNAQIFDAVGMNDLETVGDAKVSTSIVKYGTGSMAFDGTGDYLFVPNTANFGFGTGDYTVEFWIYLNTLPGTKYTLIDFRPTNTGTPHTVYVNSSGYLGFYNGSADVTSSSGPLTTGSWFHAAWCRASGTMRIFVNGTQVYSAAHTTDYQSSRALWLGAASGGSLEFLNGYLDDVRITKYARYTTNFTPGPITTLAVPSTNWKFVSCGNYFTAATKTDGTLWTWGGNTLGQLGDNTTTHRSSPVQTISSNNTWRQVSCGLNHMSALKTDGTIWSWGGNSYGNLGDNTTTHRSSPVQQIIGGITWKQISAGDRGTAAILDANY